MPQKRKVKKFVGYAYSPDVLRWDTAVPRGDRRGVKLTTCDPRNPDAPTCSVWMNGSTDRYKITITVTSQRLK